VLRSSPLRCGPWPVRCVQRVAPGSAPSCTAAHGRLASLHLGASRVAQLAAAPRPLAVPLRAWRSAWFSPKLHGGPRPPRITPPRSVACSTARRCAAALDRPAAGIAWRLVQAKAGRRPTAASHHSTSESRALRSSPLRRGSGVPLLAARRAKFSSKLHGGPQPPRVTPPQSVACYAARRCVATFGRPAA